MKKTWIRKDNKGVSPVIATILMVAITVVLAAVLYLMVSNFTDTGGSGGEPTITFGAVEQTAGNATIEIAGASRSEDVGKYKLILLADDVMVSTFDPIIADGSSGSIRGDFGQCIGRSIVHGSDGSDTAEFEIKLWFKPEEISNYNRIDEEWLVE